MKPLRRTEEEIKPPPALQMELAESIVKILRSNPVCANSWEYERIVKAIDEYTQAVQKQP